MKQDPKVGRARPSTLNTVTSRGDRQHVMMCSGCVALLAVRVPLSMSAFGFLINCLTEVMKSSGWLGSLKLAVKGVTHTGQEINTGRLYVVRKMADSRKETHRKCVCVCVSSGQHTLWLWVLCSLLHLFLLLL